MTVVASLPVNRVTTAADEPMVEMRVPVESDGARLCSETAITDEAGRTGEEEDEDEDEDEESDEDEGFARPMAKPVFIPK